MNYIIITCWLGGGVGWGDLLVVEDDVGGPHDVGREADVGETPEVGWVPGQQLIVPSLR